MSSNRKRKGFIPQTLYARLAFIFFLVLIMAAGILFGGTFATLYRSMQKEDERYAQGRLLSYWARFQATGIEGLIEDLQAESLIYDERPFFVRVATAKNETIFLSYPEHWKPFSILQNLEAQDVSSFDTTLRLKAANLRFELDVNTITLNKDYLIQVGMSSERRQAFLRLYQRNFIFFMVIVLAFGVTAALVIAGRAVSPLRRLSAALNGIIKTGDLSARLPERGTGDEMDELTGLFNRLLERIQGLIGRMRDTLDVVAHDLRTPLTRLRSGAELALQSGNDAQKEEALSDALEESDSILTLLTTLMDISEAESGILKLNRRPVDVRKSLEKLIDMYEFVAAERDITIKLGGSFPERITVDPSRFNQAAGNLLDNGVKYSPKEGLVSVTGALDRSAEVPRFLLSVENQGPPIPEEELSRIWERLYRAAGNTTQGMGLGLSMVRAVAESHGGSADVENLPEGGVRFTIAFPLSHPSTPSASASLTPR